MSAPLLLRAAGRELDLADRPLLMGIVNASPDSFSDGGMHVGVARQLELARGLVQAGAEIIDIGGESATTGRPPVDPQHEIDLVAPLIERVAAELDVLVSVDTYKPVVARAAVAAGAHIVNDVSGLRDLELADICAQTGAALVVMHTAAPPRVRRQDEDLYRDVTGEVVAFLRGRTAAALERGVSPEQLIVDPGPDFAKTPAQTTRLLAELDRLAELERPILLAVSRKDFVGALTGRRPDGRGAGTLAALAHGVELGAHIFRVHDVEAASDFLAVRAALRGDVEVSRELRLADELRWEQPRHELE